MRNFLLFVFLCAEIKSFCAFQPETLTVQTTHGPVRGTTRTATGSNRIVYSYFGIPYGRSPDYSFRFHFPVNPWPWTEVINVTNERFPLCRQDPEIVRNLRDNAPFKAYVEENHPMQEDCLKVNVFTPQLPSSSKDATKLPVIVWIHGGSFQSFASSNRMWALPAYEDVVLVTVQYRLGVFGFLSFEDEWAPPNSGLHDQRKALEWVRDNIEAFGGDPNLVTIFGLSAGGFSVSAHTVSPASKGLFHRAIAGSGVVTIPLVWDYGQADKAFQMAENLSCKFRDVPITSTCLRNHVKSGDLVNAARSNKIKFTPTVDGNFFPTNAERLIETRSFDTSIPLMIGAVAGEFDYVLSRKYLPTEYLEPGLNRSSAEMLIRSNLEKYFPALGDNKDAVREILSVYLTKDKSKEWSLIRATLDYMADALFNYHSVHAASKYKDAGNDVYFFEFALTPSFYDNDVLNLKRPYKFNRADHGDDFPFYFGFPFLSEINKNGMTFTEEEKDLSKKMMRMLATFAKTGKPTISKSFKWPQFPAYVEIDKDISVKTNYHQKRISMWRRLLNRTEDSCQDTSNSEARSRDQL